MTFLKIENQEIKLEVNMKDETVWLTQDQMSILFDKAKSTINEHIKNIYKEGELIEEETIKELEGYIDIYLPDFKYVDNNLAKKYSNAKDYFKTASKNIIEMINQVGNPKFNNEGIIQKGVIIRHLVLPNNIDNSKKVLKEISKNFDKEIYVSLMGQYIPQDKAIGYEELNRKITKEEYDKVIDYFFEVGLENGFMQELDSASEEYIPEF